MLASSIVRTLRLALTPLVAGLAMGAQAVPANAAGFFETLFGRPVQSRPVVVVLPGYAPREMFPEQRGAPGFNVIRPARTIVTDRPIARDTKPLKPVKLTDAESKSPLAPFLNDHTLARGDAVVAKDGIYVFRGNSSRRHQVSSFMPLNKIASTPSLNRTMLSAIEKANKVKPVYAAPVVVGEPVSLAVARINPSTEKQPEPQTSASSATQQASAVIASDN